MIRTHASHSTGFDLSATSDDLLLRETYHRSSNDMQLVVSLLSLQSRRATNAEARDALADAMARVAILAHARADLNERRPTSLRRALEQVCEALVSQTEPRSILISLHTEYDVQGLLPRRIGGSHPNIDPSPWRSTRGHPRRRRRHALSRGGQRQEGRHGLVAGQTAGRIGRRRADPACASVETLRNTDSRAGLVLHVIRGPVRRLVPARPTETSRWKGAVMRSRRPEMPAIGVRRAFPCHRYARPRSGRHAPR